MKRDQCNEMTTTPQFNSVRALEALGQLTGAIDRRCLADVLAAWRRYVLACDRGDLLSVPPRFEAMPIAMNPRQPAAWQYLSDVALATARNLHAVDADWHWTHAASTFMQAAHNAAAVNGRRVAVAIASWIGAGWMDRDEEDDPAILAEARPCSPFVDDLLASLAERAGHYGAIALGPIADCEHCDQPIFESAREPVYWTDPLGHRHGGPMHDACRDHVSERAAEREFEDYHGGAGVVSVNERAQDAWTHRQALRGGVQ